MKLSTVASILSGLPTHRLRGEASASVPILNVADLNHFADPDWRLGRIQVSNPRVVEQYRVRVDDIAITARGSTLKIAMVPQRWSGAVLSWNVLGIRCGARLRPEVLFAFLKSIEGQRLLEFRLTGSAMFVLTARALGEIDVPVPSLHVQQQLGDLIKTAEEQYAGALAAAYMRRALAHALTLRRLNGDSE